MGLSTSGREQPGSPGKAGHRTPWTSRFLTGVALVVLVALALRGVHLASILYSPLDAIPVQDARHYHENALRILGGGGLPAGAGFMNFGYPYFLAVVYALASVDPVAVLWVQALLGALTAGLVAVAGRRLLDGEAPALLAGLSYAVYATAIFYDGLLLTPSLGNALLAAAVALVAGSPTRRSAALAGLALGGFVLLRASGVLLLLALAATSGLDGRPRARARACILVAAALVFFLPVVLHNGLAHGEWTPVSANGGINLWIGNHRGAPGIYHAAGFLERIDAGGEREGFLAEARLRSGNAGLGLVGADRFWLRETVGEVRSDFPGWLRLEGRKLALFWSAREAKSNVGLSFHAGFSPVLRSGSVGFGALAALGIAGLVLLWGRLRASQASLVSALVGVPLATCMAFFVSGEYRHPASLGLCLAAGLAVSSLAGAATALIRRTSKSIGLVEGLALAVGVLALPLVLHRFPALERTIHPRHDYANHAKTLTAPRPDGSLPDRADIEHARDLLAHARWIGSAEDPFLEDARLAVDCRAALIVGDAASREHAADTLRRVRERPLRPSPELPVESAQQFERARVQCGKILAGLAALPDDR